MADEKDFWDEDAERINNMAKVAAKAGVVVNVTSTKSPTLNPDGSLAKSISKIAKILRSKK